MRALLNKVNNLLKNKTGLTLFVILITGLGVYFLFPVIRSKIRLYHAKNDEEANPLSPEADLNKVQGKKIAKMISEYLNLDKAWYNPSSWYENENAVIETLNKYDYLWVYIEYYFPAYSGGKELEAALKDYLTQDQLNQVIHLR